jgi:hypothetical protein
MVQSPETAGLMGSDRVVCDEIIKGEMRASFALHDSGPGFFLQGKLSLPRAPTILITQLFLVNPVIPHPIPIMGIPGSRQHSQPNHRACQKN